MKKLKQQVNKEVNIEAVREIAKHNFTVESAVKDYDEDELFKEQISELRRKKIRARAEMEGNGLRKTFIALARERLEFEALKLWREQNEHIRRERDAQRTKRTTVLTLASAFPVFLVIYAVILSFTIFYAPKFGDNMQTIGEGQTNIEVRKFVSSIFQDIEKGKSTFTWRPDVPPEMRFVAEDNLSGLRGMWGASVEKILLDPKRENYYYVKCRVDTTNGISSFRLQCCNMNGKIYLVAVE